MWLGVGAVVAAASVFRYRRLALLIAVGGALAFALGMWYASTFTLLGRSTCLLYRNESILEQPVQLENLTLRNTAEAVEFIRASVTEHQSPFLLYMAYVKVHTALFTAPHNAGRSRHGAYGDNIEELDWSVGEIMVANDTLVLFSSDNGPFLERGIEAGFCGRAPVASSGQLSGPLRGAKGQTWECGIRVPTMVRWPGVVPAGRVVQQTSSLLDFFPSLLDLWQVPRADDRVLDGQSLWPALTMAGAEDPARLLFHYCGSTLSAVRLGRYKAHFWTPVWDAGLRACPSMTICPCRGEQHDPPLLFDMDEDPAEEAPLNSSTPAMQAVLAEMLTAVRTHRATVAPVPNQLEQPAIPWLMPCCGAEALPPWQHWLRVLTGTCRCD
jgi:steryl-sulfatase